MKKILLPALLLAFATSLFAQEQQLLKGKALRDVLVGNTLYVYHPGCTDAEANFIIYFAADGKAAAKSRDCKLPMDRAQRLDGRWTVTGTDFCVREFGSAQDHCVELVKTGESTYKRIDRTGLRTDWSMAVLNSGNPEGF